MATKKKTYVNYDQKILSQQDYEKLQGYRQDWANAATDAGRQQANRNAETLRASYGYSMGADGATFSLLTGGTGVSDHTGAGLLSLQSGPKSYGDEISALLQQLDAREPFSYDPETDPVYQSMQAMYRQQGHKAMSDTVAQASALTGGYDSTYAQTVGQRAYQDSLQDLAAQIPALYSQAQDAYALAGQQLSDRAAILSDLQKQALDEYDTQREYWTDLADRERSDAQAALDAAADKTSAAAAARNKAWDQAMDSIALGVVPSTAVLNAAGISAAWAQSMANMARFKIYK